MGLSETQKWYELTIWKTEQVNLYIHKAVVLNADEGDLCCCLDTTISFQWLPTESTATMTTRHVI